MSPKRTCVLPLGLLLLVGTLGCGDEPAPVAEPGPVADEPKANSTMPKVGRDAAIAEIEKLGSRLSFDEESPDRAIIEVYFSGTEVTDAGLEHVEGLTELQLLDLHGTQVTDAGLEHLKGLTSLKELDLSATQVTDAGLAEHLNGLTNLKRLLLHGTQVSDIGLEHLRGLTNLQELWLDDTQVSDEGVKKLQQALPNCKIEHDSRSPKERVP